MNTTRTGRLGVTIGAAAALMVTVSASTVAPAQDDSLSARMVINLDAPGPKISKHIYGHFAEHLGHGIYGGFWVEDEAGGWHLNEAVIEALRKIKPANIRWPGGCFADVYPWKDGADRRRKRRKRHRRGDVQLVGIPEPSGSESDGRPARR